MVDYDEMNILEKNYNIYHNSNDYFEITLIPTYRCNFKCIYCFETDDKTSVWNKEKVQNLKKYSKETFKNRKIIKISLFGGEPMLEWELLKEYLDYVHLLKEKYCFMLELAITTNGYLIDNEKYIKELFADYKIGAIQITIDCSKKYHNTRRILKNNGKTYDKIIQNIKKIISYLIIHNIETQVHLRVNLLNNMPDEIIPLLNEFNKEEKKYIKIFFRSIWNTKTFNTKNSNAQNNLQGFYALAKKQNYNLFLPENERTYAYCEAGSGKNSVHINPDLTIWKCTNDLETKNSKLGFINNNGKAILNSNLINEIENMSPFKDAKCIKCKFLPICWGGCLLSFIAEGKRKCAEISKHKENIVNYLMGDSNE